MRTYTLGPNERLKSRKLIEQIFREGERSTIFPFRIFFLWNKSIFPLQAGFSVSSSQFKKAVHRNRIKRICRESYRLQKNSLLKSLKMANKSLSIFFIYTGKDLPVYDEIYAKMGLALEEFLKKVD